MGFGAAAARAAMLSDAEAQRCNYCAIASTAYLDESIKYRSASLVVESDLCGAAKFALASCKTLAFLSRPPSSHGTAPKLPNKPGRLRDSVGAAGDRRRAVSTSPSSVTPRHAVTENKSKHVILKTHRVVKTSSPQRRSPRTARRRTTGRRAPRSRKRPARRPPRRPARRATDPRPRRLIE